MQQRRANSFSGARAKNGFFYSLVSPQMQLSFVRRSFFIALLASALIGPVHAQAISKAAAVELAEKFIARNGYTKLPRDQISPKLDPESLEFGDSREKQLALRFNTLKPKAIGVKRGARKNKDGWSVAFDYVDGGSNSSECRVVTMDENGKNLFVQHSDGRRSYFAGFE